MTTTQPADHDQPRPPQPQSPQPAATEPPAVRDERDEPGADEQTAEAARRPRPRIALDHDP